MTSDLIQNTTEISKRIKSQLCDFLCCVFFLFVLYFILSFTPFTLTLNSQKLLLISLQQKPSLSPRNSLDAGR